MKKINSLANFITSICLLMTYNSCSQSKEVSSSEVSKIESETVVPEKPPHEYGAWYCPDNIVGFPPVDVAEWANVPVLKGKLPNEEEARSEASLIYVDKVKYPNALPLDIQTPRLATYYSNFTKKDEFVIIIQAITTDEDSIVGFRYLNGGNGSARLSEVKLLSENETAQVSSGKFISETIKIKATQEEIWDALAKSNYTLPPIINEDFKGYQDIKKINFTFFKDNYLNYGKPSSLYANKLFGNCYIQNDYNGYSEKLLLLEGEDKQFTEMKIVAGPFVNDYESRKSELLKLLNSIKEDSEC